MAKQEQKPLEELTREELIRKCYNQRNNIQQLQSKVEAAEKEKAFLKAMYSNWPINKKVEIAMKETLSYIEEVELLKEELKNVCKY